MKKLLTALVLGLAAVGLAAEQVATGVPGTYGSILDTARHLVGSDAWYLFAITDDAGYRIGTTHSYSVLAMNGAYNESDGCASVPFSTTAGDANGDGEVAVNEIILGVNNTLNGCS